MLSPSPPRCQVHPISEDDRTSECTHSPAYTALLRTWSHRMPSPAHHDSGAWDDLICARKRMLITLRQATKRALGEQRSGRGFIEEAEQATLLSKFDGEVNRCMLRLYECAADATRRQGNFAATNSYLRASTPLRQALGENEETPSVSIALFRLKLEQARYVLPAAAVAALGDAGLPEMSRNLWLPPPSDLSDGPKPSLVLSAWTERGRVTECRRC